MYSLKLKRYFYEYHLCDNFIIGLSQIDSMQSLMQCPSVLVCVGREPLKPLLLENLRKNSEEKLPGIGAMSHSSIYSEGHDSKKNGIAWRYKLVVFWKKDIVY